MGFEFQRTDLPDVIIVSPRIFEDERGYFFENYRQSGFQSLGITDNFIQTNISSSRRGVVRGMHYQERPSAQAKLVSVTSGVIFDVVVDIRKGSPDFGKWVGVTLSSENRKSLFVPEGFAHGFCAISDCADVLYSCTAEYDPTREAGFKWNDPEVGIEWPIDIETVSEKDDALPLLENIDSGFEY